MQRLLKALRRKAAERLIATTTTDAAKIRKSDVGGGRTAVGLRPTLRSATTGKSRQDPDSISASVTSSVRQYGVRIAMRIAAIEASTAAISQQP